MARSASVISRRILGIDAPLMKVKSPSFGGRFRTATRLMES